jgi:hypothetical protein
MAQRFGFWSGHSRRADGTWPDATLDGIITTPHGQSGFGLPGADGKRQDGDAFNFWAGLPRLEQWLAYNSQVGNATQADVCPIPEHILSTQPEWVLKPNLFDVRAKGYAVSWARYAVNAAHEFNQHYGARIRGVFADSIVLYGSANDWPWGGPAPYDIKDFWNAQVAWVQTVARTCHRNSMSFGCNLAWFDGTQAQAEEIAAACDLVLIEHYDVAKPKHLPGRVIAHLDGTPSLDRDMRECWLEEKFSGLAAYGWDM